MRLRIVRTPEDGGLGFELLDESGVALLHHRGFRDRQACIDGIQALIERIADAENFVLLRPAPADELRLVVEGGGGIVLARSAPLSTEQAGATLRDRILATASSQQHYEVTLDDQESAGGRSLLPFLRRATDPLLLYDFTWRSRSGEAGFECFFREDRGLYFFHFNGPDGAAILYSRGFDTAPRRDSRLRAVVENAGIRQRFERIENDGLGFFLKSRNGQEIARSRAYASEAEREAALSFVASSAARYGEAYVRRHDSRLAARDQYRLDLCGVAGAVGFHLLRHDEDRLYYFVFQDEQGRALFFSQGYRSRDSRDNGLRSLIRNGAEAERTELLHEDGRYYWVLRAANHQALARSQWFTDREAAAAALVLFRGQIPLWAEKLGIELAGRRSTRSESLTLSAARPADRREDSLMGAAAIAAVLPAVVAPAAAAPSQPLASPPAAPAPVAPPPPAQEAEPPHEVAPPPAPPPVPLKEIAEEEAQPDGGAAPAAPHLPVLPDESAAPKGPPLAAAAPAAPPPVPPDESVAPKVPPLAAAAPPAPPPPPPPVLPLAAAAPPPPPPPVPPDEGAPARHFLAPAPARAAPVRARSRSLLWGVAGICALVLLIAWCLRLCGEPAAIPVAPRASDAAVVDLGQAPREGRHADLRAAAVADLRAEPAPDAALRKLTIPGHPEITLRPGVMEAELLAYLLAGDGGGEGALGPRTFTMDRLRYPTDSHEMNDDGKEQTYLLGLLLLAFPHAQIEIRGHSDRTESEKYTGPKPHHDYPLSKLRAHCVYMRVVNQGVSPERLRMTGLAATRPVTSGLTDEDRQQDRRVELIVRR